MSKLVYPKLSRREIVTILVEAQIIISEQDLLHPNPDLISDLYTRVLTTFYFLPEETRIDLVAKVVDQLTHLQNEHISCEGQVSQWNAEITHYNETKKKELPLVEEVDSRVKELRQTISDLNLEQVNLLGS
ncbi:hypothetical protein ACLB2K_073642 [Fragaria x ananassa]